MAADNRAYTQFEDTHTPAVLAPANGLALSSDPDAKTLKTWKNSRRLCWALLATSIATVVLEITGTVISGVHLDWFLSRFVAGIWLAVLGIVSAALGLVAFKNPYKSSKCLTISHFSMTIVATVAYGILFIFTVGEVYRSREDLEIFHDYVEEHIVEVDDVPENSTLAANTTDSAHTVDYDAARPLLNAIKGNMAVSVLLLGTILAFFAMSIVASVIICRHWCKDRQKTMTIVYMPQDASGQTQTQQVVVPSKTQVVVVPAPKSAADQHQSPFS